MKNPKDFFFFVSFSKFLFSMSIKITTVSSHSKQQKIASHTHITGLGLDPQGNALEMGNGLVGQIEARKAAGVIKDLILTKQMSGKGFYFFVINYTNKGLLFAGPPGTGKTALALGFIINIIIITLLAISKEIGKDLPFCAMTGSEVFSAEGLFFIIIIIYLFIYLFIYLYLFSLIIIIYLFIYFSEKDRDIE
jgi:hypothetical protein